MLHRRLVLAIVAVLLALYFWGNNQPEAAGLIPAPWDKLAHLGWYAVLSILLLVALGRPAWPWVLTGMLLLAGWDEWHQFALPGREPGLDDWLADALGVLAGIGLHHALARRVWPLRQNSTNPRRDKKVEGRTTGSVLGAQIDVFSWDAALTRLLDWAHARESRYVTICNVHVVVSASRDAAYRDIINGSDMATPDGAPVAWMLRRLGFANQPRISGPDLMWALCERAAKEYLPVYFYGSTEATLALLKRRLREAFPALRMRMESPPFRALTAEEDSAAVDRVNSSGAGLVFVGLGCPKQERWMAEHRGRDALDKSPLRINAVMIGVGAAFDFHAGTVRRAPAWMRDSGLEWLHRLLSEPGRLWKRYLVTNTLFIMGAARQLLLRR